MNIPFFQNDNKENLNKAIVGATVLLSIFLLVQTINSIKEFSHIGEGVGESATITFTGEGEVFAVPDVSTFSFTVEKEAKTVAEAQAMVEDIMKKATDTLKSEGVLEKDIKTIGYNVYPRYDYKTTTTYYGGERVFVGYTVSQNTSVKIRNTDKSGDVLGKIGSLGVTYVSGLNFEIDDEDALKREARQMAIEDAKAKAKMLSKDLQVRLVKIVNFSENSGGYYPQPYYAKAEMGMGGDAMTSSSPTLSVGENKISSQVTITYEIR